MHLSENESSLFLCMRMGVVCVFDLVMCLSKNESCLYLYLIENWSSMCLRENESSLGILLKMRVGGESKELVCLSENGSSMCL